MSDADLRALERRWLESRSVEDEARWHAARLRAGLVTERGLVIAAGLGHEAAARLAPARGLGPLALLDEPDPTPPASSARVRAAIGLCRAMTERFGELLRAATTEHVARAAERIASVHAALAAAERWAKCPCPQHAAVLVQPPGDVLNDCIPDCCWYEADFAGQLVGLALYAIAECAGREPRGGHFPSAAAMFAPDARQTMGAEGLPDWLERAAEDAIRAAVLPWALGLRDPLREGAES